MIRYLRQIKMSISYCIIICWYWIFCAWPTMWRD